MREIHFGDEVIRVQGSPYAGYLYNTEFTSDDKRADWHRDFFSSMHDGEVVHIEPMFLLKTCWAMARCHDDAFPPFETWIRGLDVGMRLNEPWIMEVYQAIFAEMFRNSEETTETDE